MSFWLYQMDGATCTRIKPARFTGRDGLVSRYLQQFKNEETPHAWELSGAALMELIAPELDPACHLVVFDLMPEALLEACLYELTAIQGVSEDTDTDLVLACRLLYQGRMTGSPGTFKRSFVAPRVENSRQMLEAMRITGGLHGGSYFWARPRMDIGAAICPASAGISVSC